METLRTFFENLIKVDSHYLDKDTNLSLKRMLWAKLKNNDYKIDLPLTKRNSISYLAHVSGHDDLQSLIETATMDKDFSVRNKAQKQLMNKLQPCYKWLKENIVNIVAKRNVKITKVDQQILFEYTTESQTEPYIKFRLQNKELKLISFHDQKFAYKAKSYNDNISYKFGKKNDKHSENRKENKETIFNY